MLLGWSQKRSEQGKKCLASTAECTLEITIEMFYRLGEPNVSTSLISPALGISPGNLYAHYSAKYKLIDSLFDCDEHALHELINVTNGVRNVEDARVFHAHLVNADLKAPLSTPQPE